MDIRSLRLCETGEYLVDIHMQNDNQQVLNRGFTTILDIFL